MDDVLRLLGGAGEGLVDLDVFARGGFPVGDELRVDFGEQFTRDVVGGVEQRRAVGLGGGAEQRGRQGGGQQHFLEHLKGFLAQPQGLEWNATGFGQRWEGILRDSYML
ncbi:hypothetical protein D3C77_538200 [compost metagenome]